MPWRIWIRSGHLLEFELRSEVDRDYALGITEADLRRSRLDVKTAIVAGRKIDVGSGTPGTGVCGVRVSKGISGVVPLYVTIGTSESLEVSIRRRSESMYLTASSVSLICSRELAKQGIPGKNPFAMIWLQNHY